MKRKPWMTWESRVMCWRTAPSHSFRRMWGWSRDRRKRELHAVSTEEDAEDIGYFAQKEEDFLLESHSCRDFYLILWQ